MADETPPVFDVASTALFVELVVVGCGAATALAVGAAAVFGWRWLGVVADAGPLVVAVLAGVYVLGIVTDRVADRLGDPLSSRWRARLYRRNQKDPAGYEVDLIMVLHDAPLSSRLAYGRSRLRVVRGWTLNSLIGGVALVAYLLSLPAGQPTARVVIGLAGLVTVIGAGCAYAWWRLATAQFEHVMSQADVIRTRAAT